MGYSKGQLKFLNRGIARGRKSSEDTVGETLLNNKNQSFLEPLPQAARPMNFS